MEALNIAIDHNGTILQAKKDVEAAAGVAVQTRAILFPHLGESASYSVSEDSLIEANQERRIPFGHCYPATTDWRGDLWRR